MSKVFTIDQGALGNATITSGSEPRDVAPAWIGDSQARGAVQTPDAAERNAAVIGDPTLSVSSGVQSPDAADRNAAYLASDSEQSGAVQSPDAMDRNLASITGSTVRDSEPVWIGDTAGGGMVAPVEGSPEETTFDIANTGSGAEPRDTDPTWIGDSDNPDSPSGSEGAIHQE
jgi:hypothetical protein